MDGLVRVSDLDLDKLFRKNALLDVLGNDGFQICVVGDTSTGKSTVINFLLGFPINFEASGIGTRRPCVLTQVQKKGQTKVQFEARFCKAGKTLECPPTEDARKVASIVTQANNHRNKEFFDVLPRDCDDDTAYEQAFDFEPVYVKMSHEDFKYGLRLVDLPGLTRRNPAPMSIAETYIQPGNVAILVMGKDNASNGGFPDLAQCMVACSQVLVIQNFAYSLLTGGNNVDDNYECIQKNFQKRKSNHGDNLKVYCVDFGLPKVQRFVEDGRWRASTPEKVQDQEDWTELACDGGLYVQECMYRHASAWGNKLEGEFPDKFDEDSKFCSGIGRVLKKVVAFGLEDIDGQTQSLKDKVKARIEDRKFDLDRNMTLMERLADPAEWQDLLSKLSVVVSEYLDTTIAIPEEKEDREAHASLQSVDEEVEASQRGATDQDEDEDEVKCEECLDPDPFHWFGRELDTKILELVSVETDEGEPLDLGAATMPGPPLFEKDEKLACLRSWFRLLDEFTAMLAFAPMPYITLGQKTQAYQRIGHGQAADINKLDTMVELVSRAKLMDSKFPIRSQLQTFKKRFRYLCKRDLRNAVRVFGEDLTHEIKNFLDLINDQTEERKQWLLEKLEKALLDNAETTIRKTIDGCFQTNKRGERITDPVSNKRIKEETIGLRTRIRENSDPGPCHWLIPFKAHYLNGQLPWQDLHQESEQDEMNWGGLRCRPSLNEEQLLDEVKEDRSNVGSMNAVTAVNMRIFELAVSEYDMPMGLAEEQCNLEVMKLLKAMQAEVAAFWASAWKNMIQSLIDPTLLARDLQQKVVEHLKDMNLWQNLSTENVQDLVEAYKRAMDRVTGVIAGYNFPSEVLKNTQQELLEAKKELQLRYSGADRDQRTAQRTSLKSGMSRKDDASKKRMREKPINYNDPWPGIDEKTYNDLMAENDNPDEEIDGSGFPGTRNEKCAGEMAWMRLCSEFIFVILQLAMSKVGHSELEMARASSGKTTVAGPFDIITKLVLHRLRGIFQVGGIIFRTRMKLLYQRDLQEGMKTIANYSLNDISPKEGGAYFIQTFLSERADRVVQDTLGRLQAKFDELTPFDFSILNGRMPLLSTPVHVPDFSIQFEKGLLAAVVKEEGATRQQLLESWKQALQEQWPKINGKMMVVDEQRGKGDQGGKILDHETNVAAIACLNDGNAKQTIEHFSNLKDLNPPAPGMAGGAFHATLLRIHKAMHVNAIDHCRPKLKEMMAQLYQVHHVRAKLQRNKSLGRKMWEELEEKAKLACKDIQARIDIMENALRLADRGPLAPS